MSKSENSVTVDRATPVTMRMDVPTANKVVDLVREYLGRDLDFGTSEVDGDTVVAFTLDGPNERPLSVPELTAVETLAKYFRDHAPGLRRGKTLTLPRQVDYHSYATTKFAFRDERRAYIAAQMIEECFDYGAEVVETRLGWTIVISPNPDEPGAGLSAEDLCMIQGACQVATDYELVPTENKQYRCEGDELTPDPAASRAWHNRKNAPLARIEDGINALLGHIGTTADMPNGTPSTGLSRINDLLIGLLYRTDGLESMLASLGAKVTLNDEGRPIQAKVADKPPVKDSHAVPAPKPSPASKKKSSGKRSA